MEERNMRLAILAGMAALAGCAASPQMQASQQARSEREIARALDGRLAGAPVDCISDRGMQGPQVIDANTILYRESGRRIWRNDLEAACPALSPTTTMIVEIHGAQLCRNDRFRVVEPGTSIPSAYCRLGRFTPYMRERR
jgi:hypothetical protein